MKAGVPWRRLLGLAAPEWRWVAGAVAVGAVTVGAGIGLSMTSAWLIAFAALASSVAQLHVAIAGVRLFGLSRAIARYAERIVSHEATFRILARLRVRFYRAVEPQAPARLNRERSGDLLARFVGDIESLDHVYARFIGPVAVALLTAGVVAAAFHRTDARLAAAVLFFYGVAGWAVPLATRALGRRTAAELVRVRAAYQARAVDAVQGMAELLVFGREAEFEAELDRAGRRWARLQRRMSLITGLHESLTLLLSHGAVVAVVALAAPAVAAGRMDGVWLAVCALGTLACFEAVAPVPLAFQYLEQSAAAAGRVFALADAPPPVAAPAGPAPEPASAALQFEDVTFAYDPSEAPALRGVSLSIPAGARIAIVGPSGAGKSTLVHLLLRFRDPDSGTVRLGGHDLREFATDDLARLIAVAPQSPWLFHGTLRDQMRLARPDATDDDLRRAARLALIDEWIAGLPAGWDTPVGEQGLRLSGGERRRVALAQAFLRAARVRVFDEPTADLDPAAERHLMGNLWAAGGDTTVIVITHRLVGLERADRVILLEDGRIAADGPHDRLAAECCAYRRINELQREIDTVFACH